MDALRAPVVLTGFLVLTILCAPVQWLALQFRSNLAKRIPYFYHRLLCRLIGIRVRVVGHPIEGGGLLLANHTSWLDIIILSAVAHLSFVAKSEVNGWFLFGFLARLQRTIFVRRDDRSTAMKDRDRISERINAGEILVIFPEGTSSDGNRVLPFKSALVGAAELPLEESAGGAPRYPLVQPVSVAYVASHGLPMGRETRPSYAWYGDMDLFPHLWEAFSSGPLDVVVEFHEPMTSDKAGGRKQIAAAAETAVRAGLLRALHGEPAQPPPTGPGSGDIDSDTVSDEAEGAEEAEAAE